MKMRRIAIFVLLCIGFMAITFKTVNAETYIEEQVTFDRFTLKGRDVFATFTAPNKTVFTVNLTRYDYYAIINEKGETRYFIADALPDSEEGKATVFNIMLYNEDSLTFSRRGKILLSVTCFIKEMNDVIKIEEEINNTTFQLIVRNYKVHTMNNIDELSERLNASINFLTLFKGYNQPVQELDEKSMQALGVYYPYYANENESLLNYIYRYETDEFIDRYVEEDFGNCGIGGGILTDDPIVRLVPKYLLLSVGKHTYIGQEYGFYINVTREKNYNFITDVMIFDVDHKRPYYGPHPLPQTYISVKPMFQFRYYAKQKGTMSQSEWNEKYDPLLTDIVYPHVNYDSPNYYLTDIRARFTLSNITGLNRGEPGYIASQDEGCAFSSGLYEIYGEGKTTHRDAKLEEVKFSFGYPNSHAPMDDNEEYTYGVLYPLFNDYIPVTETEPVTHYVNYPDYAEYGVQFGSEQITLYGGYIKSVWIEPVHDSEDPVLIGTRTENNSVTISAWTGNSTILSTESELHISLYLKVVSDDTYFLLFLKFGSVNKLDAAETSYYYCNFSNSKVNAAAYTPLTSSINDHGASSYFLYVPYRHDSTFVFETEGTCDLVMTIYAQGTGEVLAYDDDSGEGNNPRIVLALTEWTDVIIVVSMYNPYHTGTFTFTIKYDVQATLLPNKFTGVIGKVGYWVTVEFIPPFTNDYVVRTQGKADPIVRVEDNRRNILAEMDNYNGSKDVFIWVRLEGGVQYFIRIYVKTSETSTNVVVEFADKY